MVELTVSIDVDADVDTTWRAATDWGRQGRWIPATQVRVTRGTGRAVGDRIVARTGIGALAFDDEMEIRAIEAPYRCEVVHLGRVVRGSGLFVVGALPAGRSRFSWTERLDLPFGRVGRAAFLLILPFARAALHVALRRFARDLPC
jgi:hypothetical protein